MRKNNFQVEKIFFEKYTAYRTDFRKRFLTAQSEEVDSLPAADGCKRSGAAVFGPENLLLR